MAATVDRLGTGHDADETLARSAWCTTRVLRPERVVETGVARGASTRAILEAMAANGRGHLWSIDLPPVVEGWHRESAVLVPENLRVRWTFIRSSTRRELPPLLARVRPIDLFVQGTPDIDFELRQALGALRPGGVVLADCIERSPAFRVLVDELEPSLVLVAPSLGKDISFGIVVK
jgi:hypothetical protein